MGYIEVITHLRTIDPNFQRDIQVVRGSRRWILKGDFGSGPNKVSHPRIHITGKC